MGGSAGGRAGARRVHIGSRERRRAPWSPGLDSWAETIGVLLLAFLCLGAARPAASPTPPDPVAVARVARAVASVERAFAEEPSASLVQAWAARAASVSVDDTSRLRRRGRAAAGLPFVRMRGRIEDGMRTDRDELALVEGSQRHARWSAELWMEWDLAEAVGGAAPLRLEKEAREQIGIRQALAQQVVVAYHDRQRLLLEDALDPPDVGIADAATLARAVERQVRVRELDATLDAMTGGRWGMALQQLAEEREPRWTWDPPSTVPDRPPEPSGGARGAEEPEPEASAAGGAPPRGELAPGSVP